MTNSEIAAARAVIDAATEGPWHLTTWRASDSYGWTVGLDQRIHIHAETAESEANATFIAAARTGWPAALDEVERLQKQKEELRLALRNAVRALHLECGIDCYWECAEGRLLLGELANEDRD